jgi:hypothetical protein
VAIGCVVAALGIGVIAVVAFGGLGYWAAGKAKQAVEEMAGDQKKMTELAEKANANPFTEPADHTITEPRLVAFLEVRKRVYDVYLRHQTEIDALIKKDGGKDTSFSDIKNGMVFIAEARQARLQGLVDAGMSEAEYTYYVASVYTSMVGSEVSKATGGKKVSEVVHEMKEKSRAILEQQAKATPDPSLPAEAQKAMREAQEQAKKQLAELDAEGSTAEDGARSADVPEVNIAIYRKHEAEIKKYAMAGLEVLL